MRGHGLPGPDGANFARGVIADGEHEIELGSVLHSELIPALRPEVMGGIVELGEKVACEGMNGAAGMGAGAVTNEPTAALPVQNGFRQD
jgi:hypothetical protein